MAGTRRVGLAALAAISLAWCLGAGSARADGPDAATRMAARDLAMAGAEAFDKQDFAAALDRFERAESLYKVPSISIMLARCYARLGRLVEAVDKYEETLRVPLDATAPEAFQRAVAEARTEVEAARSRVARLEVRLPPGAPAGARVILDDKLLKAALLGIPIAVDPGPHHVAAHAPGRQPYNTEIKLAEGESQALQVWLAPQTGTSDQDAPMAPPAHRKIPLLSWALFGVGGAGVAVGAISGVAALSHKSKLDESCSPGCPPALGKDLAAFRFDRSVSYLGFGVGLAAFGAGAYLLLREGSAGHEVGAVLLPGAAYVRGRF